MFVSLSIAIAVLAQVAGLRSAEPGRRIASDSDIHALLRANGTEDIGRAIGVAIAQQSIPSLHRQYPTLGQSADARIMEVIVDYVQHAAERDRLADTFIPVYARYFSDEEVRALTVFYRSPVGRKLVSVTPEISIETSKLGQQWLAGVLPGLHATVIDKLRSEKLMQ
jgi:uncharacterized protein